MSFNRQTGDGIEWAGWSWNPVTGCLHGCPYCYARDIERRYGLYPKGFKPDFHPEKLNDPQNTRVPKSNKIAERLVFSVSMGDLFGDWVPDEWIDAVFEAVRKAPQWTFLFLTKNPKRYIEIDFPANVWIGSTIDCQKRVLPAIEVFKEIKATVKFVSFEPLQEEIAISAEHFSCFDWVIIGGQSQPGGRKKQPPWEWVENILGAAREAGCKLYLKPNLSVEGHMAVRPKEHPIIRRRIVRK